MAPAAHRAGARGARLLAWVFVGMGAGSGCMFLVGDELGSIACMDEGSYGPPACPDGHACLDGLCAPRPQPAPAIGTPCESDADCNEGDFCLDPASFRAVGARICSRNCCSSIDCDEVGNDPETTKHDAVCWVPKTGGGSFCRTASALERGATGAKKAGDKCLENGECRSGVCREERCSDACCSDTNCELSDSRCLATDGVASDGAAWACGPGATGKGFLEPCTEDAECATGLCIKMVDTLLCSRPCCDSASCGPIAVGSVSGHLACVHLARHGSLIAACAGVLPLEAELPVGAPCTGDLQCRSGSCTPGPGGEMERLCSDVCCVDADCGDPTISCRPAAFGDHSALQCTLE